MRLIPNSWGSSRLREVNTCHNPPGHPDGGGRFCSGKRRTLVGITSATARRTDKKRIFAQMRQFERKLRAIPTVTEVKVQQGRGGYMGGSEWTWVVSYRGNGEATKLLKATKERYNQQAVLMLKGATSKMRNSSPSTVTIFEEGPDRRERDAIEKMIVGVFGGAAGWTWYRQKGTVRLRITNVPKWSNMTRAEFLRRLRLVRNQMRKSQFSFRTKIDNVRAHVL